MEREMTIEEVRQICGDNWRNHLDNYIEALLYFKERGEKVYWNFNGHILHSENITHDSAYMEVMGEINEESDTKTGGIKKH